MKINLLLILLLFFCFKLLSQSTTPIQLCPDEMKWNPSKALPAGAEVTVIEGDPKAAAHFTIRVKLPAHYVLPPHQHPVEERTTVLSGSISIGMGAVIDTVHARRMTAGCFYLNPANTTHYAFTNETETVVQISTIGPWGFKFLENPTGK